MKYGGWILSDLTPCNLTQNEWLLSLSWEVKILSEENLGWPSFPSGSAVKNPPAMQETQEMWVQPPGGEDPLEEGTATHSSVWPGESHGQRSLAGCSPRGCQESDMTEPLSTPSAVDHTPPAPLASSGAVTTGHHCKRTAVVRSKKKGPGGSRFCLKGFRCCGKYKDNRETWFSCRYLFKFYHCKNGNVFFVRISSIIGFSSLFALISNQHMQSLLPNWDCKLEENGNLEARCFCSLSGPRSHSLHVASTWALPTPVLGVTVLRGMR